MAEQKRDTKAIFNAAAVSGGGLVGAGALLMVPGLGFAAPAMLAGLAALGPLWYVMSSTPPKPTLIKYPTLRILRDILPKEQKPVRMPLWHRLLRTAAAAAVLVGLAGPQWNPDMPLEGKGPVMLVVDNGWAAARNWQHRVNEMSKAIDRAEHQNRPVIFLPTAPAEDGAAPHISSPLNAVEARAVLKEMKPQAWPTDHKAAITAVAKVEGHPTTLYLSDDVQDENVIPFIDALKEKGDVTVVRDKDGEGPRLIAPMEANSDALTIGVRRLDSTKDMIAIVASDDAGHVIAREEVTFKAGESEGKAVFKLPSEIRNQLARVSIEGDNSAGSTVLLDERWRHRPVGLIGEVPTDEVQLLLSETGYIQRAIGPFVDLHSGSIAEVMKNKMSVIVLTDGVVLDDAQRAALERWTQEGGLLVRFAGPHLADADHAKDTLLPVELRPGSRSVSTLAEEKSGKIANFEKGSPFYGMKMPEQVTVERYVLAQPSADLDAKTWARMDDGTPLVTASAHGKGTVVLVHTTANRQWSNMAYSGFFVDMLRSIVGHAQSTGAGPNGTTLALPPIRVMDGLGQFRAAGANVKPLTSQAIQEGQVTFKNPPGLYGNESLRVAHNLASAVPNLKPLHDLPTGVGTRSYAIGKGQTDLGGISMSLGLGLLGLDFFILLSQRGAFGIRRKQTGPALDKEPRM